MIDGSRQWRRPSWIALALCIAGVMLFVRLAVWQLDRGAQAQALLDAFAAAASAPLETQADACAPNGAPHFARVQARGHFVADRGYWRDEVVRRGRVGAEAIGVFALDDADCVLLIDRGWVEWNHAPGTQPVAPPIVDGKTDVSGILAPFPGSGVRVGGNALATQRSWPKLTLRLDAGEIGADLQQRIAPRILLQDPDPGSGWVREWTPNILPPARHYAYAVQWFAFALTAVALLVVLHRSKVEKRK